MSSVQHLREFISERLTAAAEEIFTEFEKTIVQYEEEIDRQRRLLDINWKPPGNFHTAESPHECVRKMDVRDDEQLCNQNLNSNPDQETPESVHIKEEEEELPTSRGEELLLKDETDNYPVTPTHEEIYHSDLAQNRDYILSYTSPVEEHSHMEGSELEDSGTTSFERLETVHTDKEQHSCEICGKSFRYRSKLNIHMKSHTGDKPYSCQICGKCFLWSSQLLSHKKIHKGEKPYPCKICRKSFSKYGDLTRHVRTHTGEKPYSCTICEKCFSQKVQLTNHMRSHTGEKPYLCKTCGKCFGQNSSLVRHVRIHTGEKPYSCDVCGRCFAPRSSLVSHMRVHTGEKPYSCETCGKCFSRSYHLVCHMKTHSPKNSEEAFLQ